MRYLSKILFELFCPKFKSICFVLQVDVCHDDRMPIEAEANRNGSFVCEPVLSQLSFHSLNTRNVRAETPSDPYLK